MIYLHLALYCEGTTDDRFLPALIERTAQRIVLGSRDEPVEVLPVYLVNRDMEGRGGDAKLLQAARIACEYDILIIHNDADTQTHREVLATRFDPGKELIRQAAERGESVCKQLVPIVPVKTMEAWLLADWQTVLEEVETDITPKVLRAEMKPFGLTLPSKPHQAAADRNPKHTLEQIIRITCGRRQITRNDLYEPMGSRIKLETLERTEDYRQFVEDLTAALVGLGKIQL